MQHEFEIGPYSEDSSINIQDKKLVIESNNELKIPNVGQTSHEHNVEYGLFSKREYKSDETKIGGIFESSETHHTNSTLTKDTEDHTKYLKFESILESEEHTYKSSGQGGTVEGRDVETTCCGLTARSSEESSCCTSDSLCGYKCSMNWCGQKCSLNINTVCCFRPICNIVQDMSCPSVPTISCCELPSLDDLGNCVNPAINSCRGVINQINCEQVVGCLREAWPVVRDVVDEVVSLLGNRR